MSTKIYYGYRYVGSFHSLHTTLMGFAESARALIQKRYLQTVAAGAVRYLDLSSLGLWKEDDWKWPITSARDAVQERMRQIRKTQRRDPENDFSFSVCILPRKKEFLLMRFCEENVNKPVCKQWDELPGMEYYGYWNNTDAPEDVSALEWLRRKKAWDEVLPGPGIPSLSGYSLEVVSEDGTGLDLYPSSKDLLPLVASKKKRAEHWTLELAVQEIMRKEGNKENVWESLMNAMEAAKKDKRLLAEKRKWVTPRILEVTKELLIGGDSGSG